MARRRSSARTIFLPWERQGGLLRRLGLGRIRFVVAAALVVMVFLLLRHRERQKAAARSTRATLLVVRRAVDAFRADHNGDCPKAGLDQMVTDGYLAAVPRDAWGGPLRLVCPSRKPEKAYDLLSDGPDREPGGLDRVE